MSSECWLLVFCRDCLSSFVAWVFCPSAHVRSATQLRPKSSRCKNPQLPAQPCCERYLWHGAPTPDQKELCQGTMVPSREMMPQLLHGEPLLIVPTRCPMHDCARAQVGKIHPMFAWRASQSHTRPKVSLSTYHNICMASHSLSCPPAARCTIVHAPR